MVKFVSDPSFQEEQRWVRWLIGKLSCIGPNTWTGLRIPFFLAALAYFYLGMYMAGMISATIGFLTDWIDGKVARFLGIAGETFGAIFDGSADKLILFLITYLGWNFTHPLVIIILWVVEVFGVPVISVFFRKKDDNIFEHLMVGKFKFALQIILFYILWTANYVFPDWIWWPLWINILLSVIILLAFFSVICKIDRKLDRFLADSITLENLLCGVASAIFASAGNLKFAAALISVAGIFDVIDGMVARKVGSNSKYGDIKDSAGDLISFGLAPAVLFFVRGVHWTVCLFFFCCTFVRLRYYIKVHAPEGVFFGFPCPAAAIFASSFLLWHSQVSASGLEIIVFFCAILQVSFFFDNLFGKLEFKWYHAKKFSRMPRKAMGFFLAAAAVLSGFGLVGEAVSFIVTSYLFLSFKPVADMVFGWGKGKDVK
jgi:phosphatidylserine synthase